MLYYVVILLTSGVTAEKNMEHLVTQGWLDHCYFYSAPKMFGCVRRKVLNYELCLFSRGLAQKCWIMKGKKFQETEATSTLVRQRTCQELENFLKRNVSKKQFFPDMNVCRRIS